MRIRKMPVEQERESKVLDVNASMQGTLRFDDPVNLRINGKFEGTLDTKGELTVGQNAEIKANILGESILITGRVVGNIKATKVLKLEASANLSGNVDTPRIVIMDGAVLNGRVNMSQEGEGTGFSRGDWMTTDQLAKYLEVDTEKVNRWADERKLPATRENGGWIFERSKVDEWIASGRIKG